MSLTNFITNRLNRSLEECSSRIKPGPSAPEVWHTRYKNYLTTYGVGLELAYADVTLKVDFEEAKKDIDCRRSKGLLPKRVSSKVRKALLEKREREWDNVFRVIEEFLAFSGIDDRTKTAEGEGVVLDKGRTSFSKGAEEIRSELAPEESREKRFSTTRTEVTGEKDCQLVETEAKVKAKKAGVGIEAKAPEAGVGIEAKAPEAGVGIEAGVKAGDDNYSVPQSISAPKVHDCRTLLVELKKLDIEKSPLAFWKSPGTIMRDVLLHDDLTVEQFQEAKTELINVFTNNERFTVEEHKRISESQPHLPGINEKILLAFQEHFTDAEIRFLVFMGYSLKLCYKRSRKIGSLRRTLENPTFVWPRSWRTIEK